MSDNPYAPPESPTPAATKTATSLRGLPYYLLLLAFAGYCLAVERWVDAYSIKDLVSTGSVPALPILCFLAGSVALMAGIARVMFLPWLGKRAFQLAGAILVTGIAAVAGDPVFRGATRLLFGFGLAVSLAGWLVVDEARKIILEEYSEGEAAPAEVDDLP